jgi:hypothetical protein
LVAVRCDRLRRANAPRDCDHLADIGLIRIDSACTVYVHGAKA